MKKRTKLLAVVVATVMAASTILTGCGEKENTGDEKQISTTGNFRTLTITCRKTC